MTSENYWTEEEKGLNKDMKLAVAIKNKDWIKQLEYESNQFIKDQQAHEREKRELINEIYDLCHNAANDKANLDDIYEQKLKDINELLEQCQEDFKNIMSYNNENEERIVIDAICEQRIKDIEKEFEK